MLAKPHTTTAVRSLPATPQQQEIWLSMQQGLEAQLAWIYPATIELTGEPDLNALRAALTYVVQRNEALRATIADNGETLLIYASVELNFESVDFSAEANPEAKKDAYLAANAATPFDLTDQSLFRASLLTLAKDKHILLLTFCHLIADGGAGAIVIEEIAEAYGAICRGEKPNLPLAEHLSDYMVALHDWEQSDARPAARKFWLTEFETHPPRINLPNDLERPSERNFGSQDIVVEFNPKLTNDIRELAKELKVSLFVLLLAAHHICLNRWTGEDDICVGIPAAGNHALGFSNVVGHCINMVPLHCVVNSTDSARKFISTLKGKFYDALGHQGFTYSDILREARIARQTDRPTLIPAVFNLNPHADITEIGGLKARILDAERRSENAEMFFNLYDTGETINGVLTASRALFTDKNLNQRVEDLKSILSALCENPDQMLAHISLVGKERNKTVLELGQGPADQSMTETTAAHLIRQQIESLPEKPAIHHGAQHLTYYDVGKRAASIRQALLSRNIEAGSVVGVCIKRGVDLTPAILGIWAANCIYLPIDGDYPPDRISLVVDDSNANIVLVDEDAPKFEVPTLSMKNLPDAGVVDLATVKPTDTAYMIYTSGSTGTPNGVRIGHAALANFLQSMAQRPGFTSDNHLLAGTTVSFDISLLELLLPLTVGGQLTVMSTEDGRDGFALSKALSQPSITHYQATPSSIALAHAGGWTGNAKLTLMVGGEALSSDLRNRLVQSTAAVWNMYGPTETTIWSAIGQMNDGGLVTVGRPIHNTDILILDESGNLCSPCIAGEVVIGGKGLAEGYHQRPEKNSERFCKPKFSDQRYYRTGDLGKILPDGEIQISGRLDDQIKLRGHRIETGEIETKLREIQEVEQACVHVQGQGSSAQLVGYVVCTQAAPTPQDIAAQLRTDLPEIMIPARFMYLEELPKTPNGKIDRKALPLPDVAPLAPTMPSALATPTEQKLADLWRQHLSIDAIRGDDNFFDMGGYSLLAMRVIADMEAETGMRISPVELVHQSLSQLAARYDSLNKKTIEETEPVPVSHAETRPNLAREPFFIPSGDAQIYGVYHAGRSNVEEDDNSSCAALICNPLGQEAIRSHRALVQLADRLAAKGIPTLRFDYRGTGDSSGNIDDTSANYWPNDILTAAQALRDRSNVQNIVPIGMRLGADLLMQTGPWEKAVLWNPIIDLSRQGADLRALQQDLLVDAYITGPETKKPVAAQPSEVLGMPIPEWLYDPRTWSSKKANYERLLVVANKHHDHFADQAASLFEHAENGSAFWLENPETNQVPTESLNAIVEFVAEGK